MAAFAMSLPAKLGEQQLACLQKYGQEHCEEFRVDTRDPTATTFAGVLRHRFASKKSAQTAFGLNLKAWGIVRSNKAARGWFRELTVEEYLAEFRDVPGNAGRRMRGLVWTILDKCNKVALHHVAKAIAEQEKVESVTMQRERDAMKHADSESKKAARWAKDPVGNAEKARWRSEQNAMFMEDRWAQRIRYAENLPPPRKRPRHILDLPRPLKYVE